jgi:hypothetical protein
METAVEWLVKETLGITLQLEKRMISHRNWELQMVELFKQAKEMEKEQIKKAYYAGDNDVKDNPDREAEQYYNETFKSE